MLLPGRGLAPGAGRRGRGLFLAPALRAPRTLDPRGLSGSRFGFRRVRARAGVGCLSLCSARTDAAAPSGPLLADARLPRVRARVRAMPPREPAGRAAWPRAAACGGGGAGAALRGRSSRLTRVGSALRSGAFLPPVPPPRPGPRGVLTSAAGGGWHPFPFGAGLRSRAQRLLPGADVISRARAWLRPPCRPPSPGPPFSGMTSESSRLQRTRCRAVSRRHVCTLARSSRPDGLSCRSWRGWSPPGGAHRVLSPAAVPGPSWAGAPQAWPADRAHQPAGRWSAAGRPPGAVLLRGLPGEAQPAQNQLSACLRPSRPVSQAPSHASVLHAHGRPCASSPAQLQELPGPRAELHARPVGRVSPRVCYHLAACLPSAPAGGGLACWRLCCGASSSSWHSGQALLHPFGTPTLTPEMPPGE